MVDQRTIGHLIMLLPVVVITSYLAYHILVKKLMLKNKTKNSHFPLVFLS